MKILPDTSRIGAIRDRVAHRRGNRNIGGIRERVAQRRGNRNIGAVAAARKQLELVFYGLRDHHVRALHRSRHAA